MTYRGDFALGSTFDLKFTSRAFTTGAPFTLAGTPVVSAYPDNSTTQLTAGITLTVDFDTVTGLNNVRVVATSGNGYAAGSNYDLVITTGTVNSVSVVGEVIGSFSLEARSAVRPTIPGRTLDISATGEAGIDWANVGSPTTALALTGTTIASTQKVDLETIKTNPVVNAGTVTFPTTATLASTTNITAGTITTATNLTTNNDKTGYALSSAGVQAIWDALTSALTTVGSVGKLLVANIDATISSRLASASYTTPPTATENADALLNRDMSAVTVTNARSPINALRWLRNKWTNSGGTLTVYKEDDTTTAWTATTTTAASDPVDSVDPA